MNISLQHGLRQPMTEAGFCNGHPRKASRTANTTSRNCFLRKHFSYDSSSVFLEILGLSKSVVSNPSRVPFFIKRRTVTRMDAGIDRDNFLASLSGSFMSIL